MKTIQSTLLFACLFLFSGSLLCGEAAEWIKKRKHNDVAYFLHNSAPRIEKYDLNNEVWLSSISLTRIPTAFHVDDEYIFVAFDKSVYRYDDTGGSETHMGNFDNLVHDLFTDGELLFVNHSNGLYGIVNSLNKQTAAQISSINQYIESLYGTSHVPSKNSIFGRTSGISPADVTLLVYNDDGTFPSGIMETPHHGDYLIGEQTHPWPDGSKVTDSSGNVYDGVSLQQLTSFATAIDDLDFHGIDIPIVLTGNRISSFSKTILETGFIELDDAPTSIFVSGDYVYAFRTDDQSVNGMNVEIVSLDELNADEPGEPVDPIGLAYTPDDAFIDKDNVLYLFSSLNASLFRWDVANQNWLSTLPLLGSPDWVEYSPTNDRIYTAYPDGKIRYLDITAESPVEIPFANLPTSSTGLVACGEFLIAGDRSGAWEAHRSFAADGTELDYKDWNYPLNQAQWSAVNRRIYHFRDSQSPNDLHWEGISETGTFDGEGETDLHGDVGTVYPIRLSPDNSLVILGSGKIYDALSLQSLNTLPETLLDATWLNDELFTLHSDALKTWTLPTYGEGASANYGGGGLRLMTTVDDKLLLVHLDSNGLPQVSLYDESFDLLPPAVILAPVMALKRNSASAVTVNWSNVAGEEQYILERKTGAAGAWAELVTLPVDTSSYTDNAVVTGNVYFYRIKADNDGQQSAYSNELEVDLTYDPIDAIPVEAPDLAFTPDDVFIDNSNILYLLSKVHKSLFRWDVSQQAWISSITLRESPEHVSYSNINHVIYTSYNDGRLFSINLSGSPLVEVAFANLSTGPSGIATAGEYLITSEYSGDLFNSFGPDGSQVDQEDWHYRFTKATWSDLNRRLYHFRDGTSPNDLLWTAVNEAGELTGQDDSPYHSSDGIRYPIRVKPDGTVVLLGSGRIYDATSLEQLNTLPSEIIDATWLGGELFVIEDSKIIQYQLPTYSPGLEFNLSGTPVRLLTTNSNKLLAVSVDSDGLPQFSVLESDLSVTAPDSFPQPEMELLEVSASTVKVGWKDLSGENEYLVERKTGTNGTWSSLGSTAANVTEFTDTTVSLNQTYYYRVAAKNGDLVSEFSEELMVGMFAPGVVGDPQVFALSESEVLVSWNAVDYASGYRIERKAGAGVWESMSEVGSLDSDFTDTTVNKGTEYAYRIVALSGIQDAQPSGEVMITTPIDPPLSPAFVETTVVGALRIDLSWTDVDDENNYLLERSAPDTNPNAWTIVAIMPDGFTSFSDHDVLPETNYVYRISASNIGGSSDPTVSDVLTTPVLTPPSQPVFSANQQTGNEIKISWDSVLDTQGYKVYRRLLGETAWQLLDEVDGQSTEYVDTTGVIGDHYEFSVIASNASGDSLRSTIGDVKMVERLLVLFEDFEDELDDDVWSPGTRGFIIAPGFNGAGQAMYFDDRERALFSRSFYIHAGGSIQFYLRSGPGEDYPWNKPEEGDELAIDLWNGLEWEEVDVLDLSSQVYDDWQLVTVDLPANLGGQEYILSFQQVRFSTNGDQWGIDNVSVFSNLPPIPEPPVFVTTQSDNEGSLLTLWTSSEFATSYKVERSTDGNNWTEVAEVIQPDCHYRDLDVVGGVTYFYRVFAVNDGGVSTEATEPTDGSTELDLVAAREAGQQDVLDNPGDFGLALIGEVDDARELGRSDILFFPSFYGLFSEEELQNAVIDGQNNVMNNPRPFGLYDYHTSHFYQGEAVTTHEGDFAALEWSLYRSYNLETWELLRADMLFELNGDTSGTFFQLELKED